MGDNGNSGGAITQTSTGYFLNQMLMFISCIIMNIVMFNCDLNIHTCTCIVSLTIILKYLLNYGIKICQNVAYHLTGSGAHQREHALQLLDIVACRGLTHAEAFELLLGSLMCLTVVSSSLSMDLSSAFSALDS
jgi:hypothetical protein